MTSNNTSTPCPSTSENHQCLHAVLDLAPDRSLGGVRSILSFLELLMSPIVTTSGAQRKKPEHYSGYFGFFSSLWNLDTYFLDTLWPWLTCYHGSTVLVLQGDLTAGFLMSLGLSVFRNIT